MPVFAMGDKFALIAQPMRPSFIFVFFGSAFLIALEPDLPTRIFLSSPSPMARRRPRMGFVETIQRAAREQGIELTSENGLGRISGHTLRPTGAQGMATLGVDT